MESTAIRANVRPSNFSTAHGIGPQWLTLEDPPHLSGRRPYNLPRLFDSRQLSAGGL